MVFESGHKKQAYMLERSIEFMKSITFYYFMNITVANTSERVRIVIPPLFNVTIQKGQQKYVVPAEFAFSCITNPERHQENTIELERAYRENTGF